MSAQSTVTNPIAPFEMALRKNAEARACSFDPSKLYVPYHDNRNDGSGNSNNQDSSLYLSLSLKQTWLHTYCNEKGIEPRIECDDITIQILNPETGTGVVIAKARVYLNDKLAASDTAWKKFSLNDPVSLDSAVQMASGSAQSRALSNAGFGCISSIDAPSPDGTSQDASVPSISSSVPSSPPPCKYGDPMPMANPPAANNYTVPGQQTLPGQQVIPEAAPAAVSVADDPIMQAKAMVFLQKKPSNDGLHGKTLGEILATKPKFIVTLAGNKRSPYYEAANLLLSEAQIALGLPVIPNP